MHLVLLCGGSGSRLWPLSNGLRAKPFLRLLAGPDGRPESMLQRNYRQLGAAGLLSSALIVAHDSQTGLVKRQLGEAAVIAAEPVRRGTFAAAALAAAHLLARPGSRPEDLVCIMPADLYADDSFFQAAARLPEALRQSELRLALIGAPPRSPSAQFGYILPKAADAGGSLHEIARFVEKPGKREAALLISQGAWWNCGVYACSLGYLREKLAERCIPEDPAACLERLRDLPPSSFDKEIAEPEPRRGAVLHTGVWEDLGTWEALVGRLAAQVTGLGSVSADSADSYLVNELNIPVRVLGAPGIIVAASADGVLVTGGAAAHRVKELVSGGETESGMQGEVRHEETGWGMRIVLDSSPGSAQPFLRTSKLVLLAGAHLGMHAHEDLTEVLTVAAGGGIVVIGGRPCTTAPGDTFRIEAGIPHDIMAVTELTLMEVQIGSQPGSPSGCKQPDSQE